MYDVVIIGAGVAGLTAAIYACRANKKTLVLEAKSYGGQIISTNKIENYPAAPHISGVELSQKLYQQATELGAEIELEEVEKIEKLAEEHFKITTDDDVYEAKTIIIATGSADKKLGLANEEKLIGHGISYCATCDGAFYKGKTVTVVGGGNTALYDALYLADLAKKVYLVHRRNEFRGDAALVDKLKAKSNVEFVLNTEVAQLNGEEHLDSVTLKDGTELKTDGLFVAVGRIPATEIFRDLIDLDDGGYVKATESCVTNTPGVFVAGDVRAKNVRQLVTAASDGAVAATAAVNYLND